MESNRLSLYILICIMFVYAAFINAALLFSIMVAFVITAILIIGVEMSDGDIVDAAIKGDGISPETFNKMSSILLMGMATGIVLTIIIYKILTKG